MSDLAPAATHELRSLISSVRSAVTAESSSAATAEAVGRCLGEYLTEGHPIPECYRRADPDRYVQHVVHVESDGAFSVVALVWMPGQCTPIHDHVSWCVTGVAEGEEDEQRYELRDIDGGESRLVPTEHVVNAPGEVSALAPPGDIHRVRNSSDTLTVSLHIYGANIAELGSSIRRTYTPPMATA